MLIDDGLELLEEDECRTLLAGGSIGRVGLTVGALPVILPVNYAVVDGDVVFRTGEGTKLRASRDGTVMAFEIDAYDEDAQSGWSVLAVGRAREVTDDRDLSRFRSLGIAPWANGERTRYVRLSPEMLTGRRIARQ
jgi:nitroimidazol reductase NimA-like FMN-containing flavoprotein (pyridoxamine 5'-phosphate oxidase superfamily)